MLLLPSKATATATTHTAAAVVGTIFDVVTLLLPHCFPLPKKETSPAPPPACQQQHQCENVNKSRKLGLIWTYLRYSIELCGVCRGSLVMSKLLAQYTWLFWGIYILVDDSPYVFESWWPARLLAHLCHLTCVFCCLCWVNFRVMPSVDWCWLFPVVM